MAAVLLAAGHSQRFGDRDKLLAPLAGKPLVVHAATAIASLAPQWRIAVCAQGGGDIAALLAAQGFDIVTVDGPHVAMSRSLARGIDRANEIGAAAALVCLADMPFVTPEHLQALIDLRDATAAPVVASSLADIATPPALFAQCQFEKLTSLTGDRGASDLLKDAPCVAASAQLLGDIDTSADLAAYG